MLSVLSTIGVAFTGFCVWREVRIVNRPEKWVTRLAVGTFIGAELSRPRPA